MDSKHKTLQSYIDYPGKGIITDKDVYEEVKKHSTIKDRIDPRKMVEMTLAAQCILMGLYEKNGYEAGGRFMFYGPNGFFKQEAG